MTTSDAQLAAARGEADPVALPASEVAAGLGVDPTRGLSVADARARLESHGPNRLAAGKKEPAWQAFLRQYQDFMQLILLGAALVNQLVTGDTGTTVVLAGLTVFNAVIGLRQESKAEESVKALSQMMKTIARVRRDGQAVEIDAARAGARRRRADRGRQPGARRRPGARWRRRSRSRRRRSPVRASRSARRPTRCSARTSRSATGSAWRT